MNAEEWFLRKVEAYHTLQNKTLRTFKIIIIRKYPSEIIFEFDCGDTCANEQTFVYDLVDTIFIGAKIIDCQDIPRNQSIPRQHRVGHPDFLLKTPYGKCYLELKSRYAGLGDRPQPVQDEWIHAHQTSPTFYMILDKYREPMRLLESGHWQSIFEEWQQEQIIHKLLKNYANKVGKT